MRMRERRKKKIRSTPDPIRLKTKCVITTTTITITTTTATACLLVERKEKENFFFALNSHGFGLSEWSVLNVCYWFVPFGSSTLLLFIHLSRQAAILEFYHLPKLEFSLALLTINQLNLNVVALLVVLDIIIRFMNSVISRSKLEEANRRRFLLQD